MSFRLAVVMVVTAIVVFAASCAGVTRDEALAELEAAGYEPSSAECIMTSIERQGFQAEDLADPISAEVEAAIQIGVEECITTADIAGLSDAVGEDQLRADVIGDLVQGGMDPAQAECIIGEVESSGYTVVDLAQAGLEEQTEGGVIDAIATATLACQGAG